jgi:alkylation response protein AidB-like acyl-CoA dehydrogenase
VVRTHGDLSDTPPHKRHSMVLVPMDTKGVEILRPMRVMGYDDAPHGHMDMVFREVRVPLQNVILGEGEGFKIAQGRLGPGRIHHCMRIVGAAERALEVPSSLSCLCLSLTLPFLPQLMCHRATSRIAFGKPLADQGMIQHDIALSRIEIDQARLLCLNAAHHMDISGNKTARDEIAAIKVIAPRMAKTVIDRAIQCHGAMGLSQDTSLAHFWTWARILQLADGPDEVHLTAIAKSEIRAQVGGEFFEAKKRRAAERAAGGGEGKK